MHFPKRTGPAAAGAIVVALTVMALAAGCGSESSSSDAVAEAVPSSVATSGVVAPTGTEVVGSPGAAKPTATRSPPGDEAAPQVTSNGVTVTGAAGGQPRVTVTRGEPAPAELVAVDVYQGNGTELEVGGSGVFEYEGVLFSDGTTFDSSWDRGSPASLTLERVIPGWQEGLVGMRAGGRRLLIIPPADAYGSQALPGIPPNSTLIFVVDLVEVTG